MTMYSAKLIFSVLVIFYYPILSIAWADEKKFNEIQDLITIEKKELDKLTVKIKK